jgi:hypothetical protein
MKILVKRIRIVWAALLFASTSVVWAVPVTFQVNMEVQRGLGAFDPAANSVEVRGGFNGWGGGTSLTPSAGNADIYEGTVDIAGAAGTQVDYKFVIIQGANVVWEGNVGNGGTANRSLTLTSSAQTLPVVYFNNQAAPPGVVAVTFQVNMDVQDDIGNFDPTADTVEARGAFDNWGPGITLAASSANTNIYQGTANVTGSAGMVIEYKFVINKSGALVYEGSVGPGGPFGNRTFSLGPPPEQVLPVVYFNNFSNNAGAISVTFRVNMGVQVARGLFDPASGVVSLAGPFNNWSTTATPLTNSPTDPYIYVGTVDISGVSPGGTVPFKFVANTGTWETGNDRTFVLANSAQTLPVEYFDRVPDLGRLTITLEPNPFDTQITLTWPGAARIRVQTSTSLVGGVWEDVPNTLGASTATLSYDQNPGARFFRLVGP